MNRVKNRSMRQNHTGATSRHRQPLLTKLMAEPGGRAHIVIGLKTPEDIKAFNHKGTLKL